MATSSCSPAPPLETARTTPSSRRARFGIYPMCWMFWWATRSETASRPRRAPSAATRLWSPARSATVASTRTSARTSVAIRGSSASTTSRWTPVPRGAPGGRRPSALRPRVPAVWPTPAPLCRSATIRSARRRPSAAGRAPAMAPPPSAPSPTTATTRRCATTALLCASAASAAARPACSGTWPSASSPRRRCRMWTSASCATWPARTATTRPPAAAPASSPPNITFKRVASACNRVLLATISRATAMCSSSAAPWTPMVRWCDLRISSSTGRLCSRWPSGSPATGIWWCYWAWPSLWWWAPSSSAAPCTRPVPTRRSGGHAVLVRHYVLPWIRCGEWWVFNPDPSFLTYH